MAGMMRMTQFVGKGDETESLSDFLANVEMAAQSWEVTFGANADKPNATKIAIFRQNLDKEGDAWHWWTRVLSEKDKESFVSVKKAFLERYGAARNRAVSRFNGQNELMLLQQREGQSIADYVWEAKSLSDRVPADMNNMLAMVFVRGLADQETRCRVSYALRDEPEFTFGKALHMVKSWYQEIGAPDSFRPNSIGFNSFKAPAMPPVYVRPGSGAVRTTHEEKIAGTGTASPTDKAPAGFPSQDMFNQMMLNFMESMKQDFRISPHRSPGVISTASGAGGSQNGGRNGETRMGRNAGNVVCFICGGNGHFSTGCTNTPLTYAEQKKIREQFRSDRDARMQDNGTGNPGVGQAAVATRVIKTAEMDPRITEVVDDQASEVSTVSWIKVVSVAADREIVGQACATLMRMPGVAAIFEKAMVDKRVRVDDDYEQPGQAAK